MALGAYFFFLAWDINLTAWLASAGVIGIAVGFAAKDMLSNLFAGIFILAAQPCTTGDYIVLSSGERGRVEHIGLRSTQLVTSDRIQITVPNAQVATAEIINKSSGPAENERERRITTTVGIDYGADIDHATERIRKATRTVDTINANAPVEVHLDAFGEEALLFSVTAQLIDPKNHQTCLDQLNRAIYHTLDPDTVLRPPV